MPPDMPSAKRLRMTTLLHDFPVSGRGVLTPQLNAVSQAQGERTTNDISQLFLRRKPRFSMFEKMPTEIIMRVMQHTKARDLMNLIRTDKFMNRVFNEGKRSIFKQLLICQFPIFSTWFGDLPGFEGPIPGSKQTSEQVECRRRFVFSMDWRGVVATPNAENAARIFLNSLERYGGWRYLHFLQTIKNNLAWEANKLWTTLHTRIHSMSRKLATATVLCLSKTSWRSINVITGEEEKVANMARIVEGRLKFFRREPKIVRKMIKKTLEVLMGRITVHLELLDTVTKFSLWDIVTQLGVERFRQIASEVMESLLLDCCFLHGVRKAMQLCEEPASDNVKTIRMWIKQHFKQTLTAQLYSAVLGTTPGFSRNLYKGALWARGLEFFPQLIQRDDGTS